MKNMFTRFLLSLIIFMATIALIVIAALLRPITMLVVIIAMSVAIIYLINKHTSEV